jgi:putative radical SAM enzyme (TIGR03279 family)
MGKTGPGGVITAVEPGSLADKAGLQQGDELVSINGHPLRDVIDVRFYGAEEELALEVKRAGEQRQLHAHREYGQELGLAFVNPTFDVDIRRCVNRCDFCFVKQNARGMRRSLYIKDDDYRYSFLLGNFVTLTNLQEEDWARLDEQRLSPLFVSVHATEPELRRRFLGLKSGPDVVDQLGRLAELGIEVHTQVVLVPGLNDGPHLERTLDDLTALYEQPLVSVGVVPIGLTKYHSGQCRTFTPAESQAVLDQLQPRMAANRRALDRTLIYPSDEWYLLADRDVPGAGEYDGFPQVENGVGMVRQLLDEWKTLKAEPLPPGKKITLVCGTLIAPVLARIVAEWNALSSTRVRLVPVTNRYFGAVTTVSGLLAGQDVVAALRGGSSMRAPGHDLASGGEETLGDLVLLPRAMFTGRYGSGSSPPGMTLDDLSLADISAQLGVPVEMAGTLTEALATLSSLDDGH